MVPSLLLMNPRDIFEIRFLFLKRMQRTMRAAPPGLDLVVEDNRRPAGWMPVVEIETRDDSLVISAELPGLAMEDIEVDPRRTSPAHSRTPAAKK